MREIDDFEHHLQADSGKEQFKRNCPFGKQAKIHEIYKTNVGVHFLDTCI